MAHNGIHVRASPEAVFDVLDDACAYPKWVVGARRVRRVDSTWPDEGSAFHHALGVVGAELHDSTTVLAREHPRRLVLEVRFRPTGVARVTIEVAASDDGSDITFTEHPTSGPVSWLPTVVSDPALHLRNALSLQRLRSEVERRARSAP